MEYALNITHQGYWMLSESQKNASQGIHQIRDCKQVVIYADSLVSGRAVEDDATFPWLLWVVHPMMQGILSARVEKCFQRLAVSLVGMCAWSTGMHCFVYAGGSSRTDVELKPLTLRPDTLSVDIRRFFFYHRVTGHFSAFRPWLTACSMKTVSLCVSNKA